MRLEKYLLCRVAVRIKEVGDWKVLRYYLSSRSSSSSSSYQIYRSFLMTLWNSRRSHVCFLVCASTESDLSRELSLSPDPQAWDRWWLCSVNRQGLCYFCFPEGTVAAGLPSPQCSDDAQLQEGRTCWLSKGVQRSREKKLCQLFICMRRELRGEGRGEGKELWFSSSSFSVLASLSRVWSDKATFQLWTFGSRNFKQVFHKEQGDFVLFVTCSSPPIMEAGRWAGYREKSIVLKPISQLKDWEGKK